MISSSDKFAGLYCLGVHEREYRESEAREAGAMLHCGNAIGAYPSVNDMFLCMALDGFVRRITDRK
jgi:hypothetical protein